MIIIQELGTVRCKSRRFWHVLLLVAIIGYGTNLVSPIQSVAIAATGFNDFAWITIEDIGNPADPLNSGTVPGIGSVSYRYRISAYEVTNAQYVEFLNAARFGSCCREARPL